MKRHLKPPGSSLGAGAVSILALLGAVPVTGQPSLTGMPQAPQAMGALDWQGKLQFHAESAYGPWAVAGIAAYAGFLQEINTPAEWGQGGSAYGERLASTAGWAGIHGVLAFGLDSTLHQDPRYYRSRSAGFWRRSGHALRETILTHTDAGGETLSTWRIGSAYGAAFLSNLWYPDRLDTARLGFSQGTLTLGFGLASNLGAEFWPDIKAKIFHRKIGP
ncbi:MAG: hypothetical protein ABSH24_20850 [Bryobacteraceae bacterium]|jgi:hypothetical protein